MRSKMNLLAMQFLAAATFGAAAAGSNVADVPLNTSGLEAFTDDIVQPAMRQSGVPGAIVVVVGRDAPLMVKGYGVADLEAGTPVDPDWTLFGVGSISKTMTAIVASQLIAEGHINPHRDVGSYLPDLEVMRGSVTLHQLLGHRAGFDSDLSFLLTAARHDPSMSNAAIDRRLVLLRDPGTVSAYDNVGYGLVGLLASAVDGEPLDSVYRRRLFGPADMDAWVGAPGDAADRLARCYVPAGPDRVSPCTTIILREAIEGAGGVMATASAMARYLRMLLGDGTIAGMQVVAPEVLAAALDFDTYRFHPGLPGLGRAFMQFPDLQGYRVYGHGGSIPGFSSNLKVYPDAGLGLFVSFMGGQPPTFDLTLSNLVAYFTAPKPQGEALEGIVALHRLTETIARRVLPETPASGADAAAPDGSMEAVSAAPESTPAALSGRWFPTKDRSRNALARLMRWSSPFTVTAAGEDGILLNGQGPYRRIGTLLYENEDGQRIAFRQDGSNLFMATAMSIATFERLNEMEAPGWAPTLLLAAVLLLLPALIYLWPGSSSSLRRPARWALGAAVLALACLVLELEHGIRLTVAEGRYVLPAVWRIGMHLGLLALLLLPVAVLRTWRADPAGARWRRFGRRIYGTLLAAASWAIVIAIFGWGLVGTIVGIPAAG